MSLATRCSRNSLCRLENAARAACESLELRTLLCIDHLVRTPQMQAAVAELTASLKYDNATLPSLGTGPESASIIWGNRGSDGFEIYGGSANLARSIVDTAIADWARLFNGFNQAQPFGAGDTNTITLTIQATNIANLPHGPDDPMDNVLGFASPLAPLPSGSLPGGPNSDGTPRTGSVTMDNDGAGSGWYFDSALNDDSDFPTVNASIWQAIGSMTSIDYYSVLIHEIGHAIGFINGFVPDPPSLPATPDWGIASRQDDSGVNDPDDDDGKDMLYFDGPGYRATFTDSHLYGGNLPLFGYPTHKGFLMNFAVSTGMRRTISNLEANILADGYGYSRSSAQNNTMAIQLNRITHVLSVLEDPQTVNDNVRIESIGGGATIRVTLNGISEDFAAGDVTSIIINTGAGNDTIIVDSTNRPVSVNGGASNDVIEFSPTARNLDKVLSPVTVNGGGGTDNIILYDDGTNLGDTYSISSTTVTKPFSGLFGAMTYTDIDQVTLGASQGIDVLSINSTAANVRYDLYGNDGNDQFYVGGLGGGDLDAILPVSNITSRGLALYGQGGTNDQIYINDTAETAPDAWLINADFARNYADSSLTTPRTCEIWTDPSSEFLRFNGSTNANTFVRSDWTSASMTTTFDMRGGNDEVWLGYNGGNLADIQGTVSVIGSTGTDKIVAWDDLQDDANIHTVLSGEFIHAGAGQIRHSGFDNLELNTGNGVNQVFVNSLSAGQSFAANTNGGEDDLWLANSTGNVSNLGAALVTFNGGNDHDEAFFDDDDQSELASYTIDNAGVTRSGGATLVYPNVDRIAIFAPHGANQFNANSTIQNVRYEIYANGGDDTLNVGNDLDSNFPAETIGGRIVQFYGQAGNDLVNINDSADTDADGASGGTDYQDARFDVTRKYTNRNGTATSTEIRFSEHEFITYAGANHPTALDLHQAWIPTTVNGGGGDDTVFVGDGSLVGNVTVAPVINGDAGSDLLWIQDDGTSTSAAYGLSASVFTRSSAANINFGTMENMLLICSNGASDIQINGIGYVADIYGNGGADTFNLNSKLNVSTSLKGGDGDDTFFLAGAGNPNLDLLPGPTSVSGDVGNDHLVLRDSGSVDPDTYTITATTMARTGSGLVTYSSLVDVQLEGSQGATPINVTSAASGTQYNLYGSGGNDTLTVGTGDVSTVLGSITYDGGGGTDTAELDNHLKAGIDAGAPFTVTSTSVAFGGAFGGLTYSTAETLRIRGSNASNGYSIVSLPATTTLDLITGGGDSVITFGNGDLSLIDGPVQITNNGAAKTAVFNDTLANPTSNVAYTIADTSFTHSGMGIVTWNGMSRIQLYCSGGDNVITQNTTNASTRYELNGNGGADSFLINSTTASTTPANSTGAAIIDGGAGLDLLNVNLDAIGAAAVVFETAQDFSNMTISTGGSVRLAMSNGQANLWTSGLSLTALGSLTLNDNAMVYDYSASSPIVTVESYIRNGLINKGLNSAGLSDPGAAIGTANATDLFSSFPATFAGGSVDSTSVLLRYTKKGDANLDRVVNFTDLLILSQNYGLTGRTWAQGNLDYSADRTVNFTDLLTLAQNYGSAVLAEGRFGTKPRTVVEDVL